MSDQFVAEIRMFAGNFAPTGWALCDGALLPISQNTALFALLGTFYGGDGKSTFALPDLRGASPLHHGAGPGLSERFIGELGGSPNVTLLQSEMPAHTHFVVASSEDANTGNPIGALPAAAEATGMYRADGEARLAASALALAGGSQPHNNRQPYLTVTFIIALQGIFPPRS
jgi:microcystin-dependent protein